jgi:DNA-directed RNA polymerase specialized sigma24 family protein
VTTVPRRSPAGGAVVARRVVTSAQLEDFHRSLFLPLVRRAAWRHGLSKEDARDVVQEAFLLAIVKLDPKRNPKAWFIQVVDHLSINLRRKDLRHSQLAAKWPIDFGVPDESEGESNQERGNRGEP